MVYWASGTMPAFCNLIITTDTRSLGKVFATFRADHEDILPTRQPSAINVLNSSLKDSGGVQAPPPLCSYGRSYKGQRAEAPPRQVLVSKDLPLQCTGCTHTWMEYMSAKAQRRVFSAGEEYFQQGNSSCWTPYQRTLGGVQAWPCSGLNDNIKPAPVMVPSQLSCGFIIIQRCWMILE